MHDLFNSKLQIAFLLLFVSLLNAQVMMKKGWTQLAETNNFNISFVFYAEADNSNNGVVLKLENKNDNEVRYQFDLIFRTSDSDKTEHVTGNMLAHQIKAGSNDSLFWIPFIDRKFISEVGIKNVKVMITKKEEKE